MAKHFEVFVNLTGFVFTLCLAYREMFMIRFADDRTYQVSGPSDVRINVSQNLIFI